MALVFHKTDVDSPTAHALLTEYFQGRIDGFDPAAGSYQVTYPDPARFTGESGVFLLVEIDDEVVGCGGFRMLDADTAEVKHLYLRDAARGRGLGRSLLMELEQRARSLGASVMVLDTNSSLTAAGGLYSSSGYMEVEPYNDNPNATLWFRKELD